MVLRKHGFDFVGNVFYDLDLLSFVMLSEEMVVELPVFERLIFVVHELNNQPPFLKVAKLSIFTIFNHVGNRILLDLVQGVLDQLRGFELKVLRHRRRLHGGDPVLTFVFRRIILRLGCLQVLRLVQLKAFLLILLFKSS